MTSSRTPPRSRDPRQEPAWDDDEDITITVHPAVSADEPRARRELPRLADDADGVEATGRNGPLPTQRAPEIDTPLPDFLRASFEIMGGGSGAREFVLTKPRTNIGRSARAEIRLHDKKLSRRHAVIFYEKNEFRIRDSGSANGTYLNGSRVVEYALRDGDKVLVGESLLRFQLKSKRI